MPATEGHAKHRRAGLSTMLGGRDQSRVQIHPNLSGVPTMLKPKFILAATLAGLPFAASADRADQRQDHYFWEKSGAVQPVAPTSAIPSPLAARPGRRVAFGARDALFVVTPSLRSRAEVLAELREASRLGLLSHGEADLRAATTTQEAQIAAAGVAQRAAGVASLR
jgi:hypothetical protein